MATNPKFQKVKTEHTILPEFHKMLLAIEKCEQIARIIPWRISRQQKASSEKYFKITIPTSSGFKCIMAKGSTAQELFIICSSEDIPQIQTYILSLKPQFKCS